MSGDWARMFHETYERLAPSFGYQTRRESAVPWADVPEANRRLMEAVAAEVGEAIRAPALALLRRLGADRACFPIIPVAGSDEPMCLGHAARMPEDAARCEVGAAWDALEAPAAGQGG